MTLLFDDFWADKRIPREMKRCGKPPAKKALGKSAADPEDILASLPFYAAATDSQYMCHLSTYINQERHEIWNDPEQHTNPFGERLTATQALDRKLRIVEP
jgi:hypothetical protein